MSEHSPTPWAAERSSIDGRISNIADATGRDVRLKGVSVSGSDEAAANSEFVFRAINAHDDLVAALKMAELSLAGFYGRMWPSSTLAQEIRSALSKASTNP